ncbi:hypothetical protein [Paenisporosarcina sp. NPDC076898]|uniref:hypothetical protein n=1 Tax=unclassified Paenisporosarcina TaxID=2642018 RepID=UPI003CFDC686
MNQLSLTNLCKPLRLGDPYFRPYYPPIGKDKPKVFLVGINPASTIGNDKEIDEFIKLINNRDKFDELYTSERLKNNLPEISRTRLGINAFVNHVQNKTGNTILETNVISYPTKEENDLKELSPEVLMRSKEVFEEIFFHFQPRVLIFHSKKAINIFNEILLKNNLEIIKTEELTYPVSEIEKRNSPIHEFQYKDGQYAAVFVCRHLMYYGKEGLSFLEFRNRVCDYLQSPRGSDEKS